LVVGDLKRISFFFGHNLEVREYLQPLWKTGFEKAAKIRSKKLRLYDI